MKTVFLRTGEIYVTSSPALITTVVGSCISVCLWDKRHAVGGLNHFALPNTPPNKVPSNKYGELAMQNLLDEMIKSGAEKKYISAIIIGGGKVTSNNHPMLDIGAKNIDYAETFLRNNKIKVLKTHTGLRQGRKISFNTATGNVEVFKVNSLDDSVLLR